MTITMSEADILKRDLNAIMEAYKELETQHGELVAAFILSLRTLGGKFIIDQTDKDTFEYIQRIMNKEIGFQIEEIEKEKVYRFVLVEEISAQEPLIQENEADVE